MDHSTTLERPVWFVGATWHDHEPPDQTERFLAEGVWENGDTDRYLDEVKSVRPGDRIVIKSTYTRKQGLPFDNRGVPVSALKIKAVGEVTENLGDGRRLKVAWKPVRPPREWYFYTHHRTIWKVQPSSGASAALVRFALDGEQQDVESFLKSPNWIDKGRFRWTEFFSEIADKLLQYRDDRGPLIAELHAISARLSRPFPLDQFDDGPSPLQDICPFTTIGLVNRNIKDANRRSIASELATFLGVQEPTPALDWKIDGIPLANNWNVRFFGHTRDRKPGDIDALWRLFSDAIEVADMDDERFREAFVRSYDDALTVKQVGVPKLTMGLYWIRPGSFPSLDKSSFKYIEDRLGEGVLPGNAREYLELRDRLLGRFREPDTPVRSFPELTWSAYNQNDSKPIDNGQSTHDGDGRDPEPPPPPAEYTIDAILADGCFLPREALDKVLRRLRTRKNLILQGPSGTGKTWLAKKLAFALLGRKDEGRIRHLQFHPNLSYEDFVRGHRPVEGLLELTNGPLLKLTEEARNDPEHAYVMVIEEINRGNPAQIFGEMLTLLEADKRTPDEALALAFPRDERERVHVPPNVYLIGTMNVADRSLALVDLALRRRFAFVDLEPVFGESWRRWMRDQGGFEDSFLGNVADRMDALNEAISADASLGRQFRVGHSYLTVAPETRIASPEAWYREVVETEIGPLLREYWFDQPDKADAREKHLLADL